MDVIFIYFDVKTVIVVLFLQHTSSLMNVIARRINSYRPLIYRAKSFMVTENEFNLIINPTSEAYSPVLKHVAKEVSVMETHSLE